MTYDPDADAGPTEAEQVAEVTVLAADIESARERCPEWKNPADDIQCGFVYVQRLGVTGQVVDIHVSPESAFTVAGKDDVVEVKQVIGSGYWPSDYDEPVFPLYGNPLDNGSLINVYESRDLAVANAEPGMAVVEAEVERY